MTERNTKRNCRGTRNFPERYMNENIIRPTLPNLKPVQRGSIRFFDVMDLQNGFQEVSAIIHLHEEGTYTISV